MWKNRHGIGEKNTGVLKMSVHIFRQLSSEFHEVEKIFFHLNARNEDQTEDNLIFSEDLAEDCQSRIKCLISVITTKILKNNK